MFLELDIQNFQGIKSLSLDLSQGLTTFTGPNDVGKSTILRALRWVCFNQSPGSGTRFIRRSKKPLTAVVGLTVEDGTQIVRTRGPKINQYSIIRDGERQDFHFDITRTKVPDEVAKLLHVHAINFQRQIDQPLWFTETAGQVSKNLNEIVDLQVIDQLLAAAAAKARRTTQNLELVEERLTAAKAEKDRLRWVPRMLKDFAKLERLEGELTRVSIQQTTLEALLQQIDRQVANGKALDPIVAEARAALAAGQQARLKQLALERLTDLLESVTTNARAVEIAIPLKETDAHRDQADATAEHLRGLSNILVEGDELQKNLKQQTESLSFLTTELETQTEGRCPLCLHPTPSPLLLPSPISNLPPELPAAERRKIGLRSKGAIFGS